ncbi:16S rRNA (guanine(527)-N(7))-methyltransferase RsmG [Actinoplanes sp. LDG1-06]|uniref:Ribosomal RNA small subunit methyltransferase G n=1 Tax=Paractinoplanes ovalisporus TaxID=2810368 RepID=A0ABS2ABY0_9ACTN|nr:16S rRNA (guanine(527)-N(7))-methyltransferase RsmG [Actinoplanes ovalisporus]
MPPSTSDAAADTTGVSPTITHVPPDTASVSPSVTDVVSDTVDASPVITNAAPDTADVAWGNAAAAPDTTGAAPSGTVPAVSWSTAPSSPETQQPPVTPVFVEPAAGARSAPSDLGSARTPEGPRLSGGGSGFSGAGSASLGAGSASLGAGSAEAEPPAEIAAVAAEVFGDRYGLALDYARLLVTDGVVRGLIGPREAPRIWERHLVNCAVVSQIIPIGASVVDVGSGAGLPGIVLAVARPDLRITLVEPLARRTAFLSEAVTALGLDTTVTVVRGRAEDVVDGPPAGADVVTARAVAPLDRLAGWCLPLARVGGRLLALKGATAAEEAAEHRDAVAALGGSDPVLRLCGEGLIDPPTTVLEVVVQSRPKPPSRVAAPKRDTGRSGGRASGRGSSRRG